MSHQFPHDVDSLRALGQFAHASEAAEREYHDTVAAVRDGLADIEQNREHSLRDLIDQAKAG